MTEEKDQWYIQKTISLTTNKKQPPTYKQWDDKLGSLALAQQSLPWLIGDCILIGEELFGEKASQAFRHFKDRKEGTISNYVSLCRKFSPKRRRNELTPTHHKYVRAFPPDEQDEWLDRAIENNWTTAELLAEIKKEKGVPIVNEYLAGLKTIRNKIVDITPQADLNHIDALDDMHIKVKQMIEDVEEAEIDSIIEVKEFDNVLKVKPVG